MIKDIYWDTIGFCNSNCKYCPNGKKSIIGKGHRADAGILFPAEFEKALSYLVERGVAAPGYTTLHLYNWGEPFLHPWFQQILEVPIKKGFKFALSTNGSIVKYVPTKNLYSLRFSMPGFSQASYDKIHGFGLENICSNIREIISQVRKEADPIPYISIVMHYYKWNNDEIALGKEFCKELNIYFEHFCANMGLSMYMANLESEDLLTERLKSIGSKRPKDYVCPQYQSLVLDEHCNVLRCCGTDRTVPGHIVGNIYEVDFDKPRKGAICDECGRLKVDYIGHNLVGY